MKPQTLVTLRRYHLYLGVFFAPAIILFSISGALQTFRLTEEKGYGGPPPTWMVWLESVHKDQAPPHDKPRPKAQPAAQPGEHADDHDHEDDKPAASTGAKRPSPLPLKIFVVLMALGLLLSTITGLTVALANRRTRKTYAAILIVGAVIPCVLLWL